MSHPWLLITAILALAALYVVFPLVAYTFCRYRTSKLLRCPETEKEVEVRFDPRRAAYTAALGRLTLQVKDCSLWPERKGCGQTCSRLPEREMKPRTRSQVI